MPSCREHERLHDLNDLLFFAAVVDHSGFSAAARSLNLPKSSVSRHVGRLEDRLGVRLLERSTRNVRLTEIGSSYYARCKAILSELETAEQDLALLRSDPIGTIRVSCPTGLAQYALARGSCPVSWQTTLWSGCRSSPPIARSISSKKKWMSLSALAHG
jgi:DNA-binding MarR family transcriptional regulator